MARMPPHESPRPDFVEYRAQAAEFDVRASRFVGAVLAGHADGLEPPDGDEIKAVLAALMKALTESGGGAAESDELRFHLIALNEVYGLLQDAERLYLRGP